MNADDVWFRGSAGRVAALVAVLVVHVAAFVFITLPTAPFRSNRLLGRTELHRTMRIRLIDAPSRAAHAGPRQNRSVKPHLKWKRPDTAHASFRSHRKRVQQPAHAPLDLSLPAMHTGTGNGQFTVGRRLGPGRSHPRYRLPGGGHVAGAPRFHLVDPRTQGIAGVIRALQKRFGVPDPHCIDVDSWRGMTREERFAHHVTEAEIERTAEQHGCMPMQRHPDPPGTPRPPWVPPGH